MIKWKFYYLGAKVNECFIKIYIHQRYWLMKIVRLVAFLLIVRISFAYFQADVQIWKFAPSVGGIAADSHPLNERCSPFWKQTLMRMQRLDLGTQSKVEVGAKGSGEERDYYEINRQTSFDHRVWENFSASVLSTIGHLIAVSVRSSKMQLISA